ncbi:MAG: PD-(D/E)XK nuclease family protein [Coxiellaceae bacterium]|nr:MAG: PD-(D/E)XK nuclease family protein [Coxiellaceae bacterium]
MGLLWPILMPEFAPLLQEYQRSVTTINANFQETQPPVLTRVSATWQLPSYHDYAPNIPVVSGNDNLSDKVSILENESLTTAVGTVVHYWLQKFSYDGLLQWSKAQLAELKPLWRKQLMQHNLLLHQLSPGISYIEQCLQQVLEDPRAQWILQPHAEAVSEYALTAIIAGHVRHLVIDRTFVCDNVRWIIDYKTTPLNQEDPAKFLMAQRQEHQPQLQVYAEAMQLIDSRPIRLGLYFPAFGGWQEWDFIG